MPEVSWILLLCESCRPASLELGILRARIGQILDRGRIRRPFEAEMNSRAPWIHAACTKRPGSLMPTAVDNRPRYGRHAPKFFNSLPLRFTLGDFAGELTTQLAPNLAFLESDESHPRSRAL